jgi:hypothetical protein
VAIETGIATPFVLYVLGFDGLATELSYLMLLLALFSQIPKRFLWRYRPYMVGRALKVISNNTYNNHISYERKKPQQHHHFLLEL